MSDHAPRGNEHGNEPGNGHGHDLPGVGSGDWDERYSSKDRVWSGEPNGGLVTEVAGMSTGTVLDIGCGEGADAVWLAQRGWDVTAIDVSGVAITRARQYAESIGAQVHFQAVGLLEAVVDGRTYDLVSAQYPALQKTPGDDAERAMIGAVAPGGALLVIHHADVDKDRSQEHGFDPDDYVSPADVVALLDDGWRIEVDERRARTVSGGSGAHHANDLVLLARRVSSAAHTTKT